MSSFLRRLMANIALQILSLVILMGLISVAYAGYITLSPASIATGQPLSQSLMQQIKDNLDDLNTRVTTLEANAPLTPPPGGGTTTGLVWSEIIPPTQSQSTWVWWGWGLTTFYGFTSAGATTACANKTPIWRWSVPTSTQLQSALPNNTLFPSDTAWRTTSGPMLYWQNWGSTWAIRLATWDTNQATQVYISYPQFTVYVISIGLRCVSAN
jgi:hypothetical protein